MDKEAVDKLEAANTKAAEVWNLLYAVIAALSEIDKEKSILLEDAQLHVSACQRRMEKVSEEK